MNMDLTGANWRKSTRSSGNGQCVELAYVTWRKSTRSSATGECVELANLGDRLAARDSKNPDGPVLTFPAAALKAFIRRG